MPHRALTVAALCLVLVTVTVPVAVAIPLPYTWCSNVCGPTVACSTQCWAQGPVDRNWYWVDCYAYDGLFGGGGGCSLAISTSTGDLELDRFLASLESLGEAVPASVSH